MCRSLIEIARKYDLLILCDDVYNLLFYDQPTPPKRLFQYDDPEDSDYKGHVISNGTFSKLLAPGIRVGWMECPPRIVETFRTSGVLLSGGAVNQYTGGVITSMIEMGLMEQHLNFLLNKYKAGRDALCEELTTSLPTECSYHKPEGGYFIWIKFPTHIDCADFNNFCLKKFQVFGIFGQRFSVQMQAKNYLRLSFSFHSADTLREAGKRFCLAAKEYLGAHKCV